MVEAKDTASEEEPKEEVLSKPKSPKKSPPKKKQKRVKPLVPKQEKTFTFEQWASRRGVPAHHRGGMKAFVRNANRERTMEQWDSCFASY